jgi:hypothetical protein
MFEGLHSGMLAKRFVGILLSASLIGSVACGAVSSWAEEGQTNAPVTPNVVNQANAPLSSIMQVRFRDTYIPKFEHIKGDGNIFGIDVTMPLPAYRLLPIRHLTRLSMPTVVTNPDNKTGSGDLQFIDIAIVRERKRFLWAVGPVVVLPTTNDRRFGQGKWQVGPAGGCAVFGTNWLAGVLVQNPMSVGGDSQRPEVNNMVLQPFVSYDIGRGWFVRSQPQFYFNWKTGGRSYPVDLGFGRTFKIGPQVISCYVQPYWSFNVGKGNQPRNGVTAGITFLYPNFWKKIAEMRGKN